MTPVFPQVDLPDLTTEQMREVDRRMIDEFAIQLVQMMENAGSHLATLAVARYRPASCTVLAGPGGNGGGGLVAARHLHSRGVSVQVVLSEPGGLSGTTAGQLATIERTGITVATEPPVADLVIDALIGYSLQGDPHGRVGELIEWANALPAPVLALDAPSGLDLTTGVTAKPCVVADATLTLALPKIGLRRAARVVGDLYAADISVPSAAYRGMGVGAAAPFAAGPIVRVAEAATPQ
jgi:NAD(P)H-hydrate epimerase